VTYPPSRCGRLACKPLRDQWFNLFKINGLQDANDGLALIPQICLYFQHGNFGEIN
jgi:hypothetical protein